VSFSGVSPGKVWAINDEQNNNPPVILIAVTCKLRIAILVIFIILLIAIDCPFPGRRPLTARRHFLSGVKLREDKLDPATLARDKDEFVLVCAAKRKYSVAAFHQLVLSAFIFHEQFAFLQIYFPLRRPGVRLIRTRRQRGFQQKSPTNRQRRR